MVACRGCELLLAIDLARGCGHGVEAAAGHLDTVWRSLRWSLRFQLITIRSLRLLLISAGADSDSLDGGKKFGVSGAGDTRGGMLGIRFLLTSHTKHV